MRRFWKDVTVDGELGVRLDGKPLRTPGRVPLLLPTNALAQAVAAEWRACGATVDHRAMPLTGLANAAIDRIAPDPARFAVGLAGFGESDLLCYRADEPEELAARQAAAWDPLLDWARARYDVHFAIVTGIMHRAQPPATLMRLSQAVAACGPFELAALSPLVTITGSLIIALALIERVVDPETAWAAALVDEDFQADRWGRDPLAEAALTVRRQDYAAGIRLLELLE